MIYNRVL